MMCLNDDDQQEQQQRFEKSKEIPTTQICKKFIPPAHPQQNIAPPIFVLFCSQKII